MSETNLLPIRKVIAAALAALVVYGAQRLGLDLGPAEVEEAAAAVVAIIVAYLVPDPRVSPQP